MGRKDFGIIYDLILKNKAWFNRLFICLYNKDTLWKSQYNKYFKFLLMV